MPDGGAAARCAFCAIVTGDDPGARVVLRVPGVVAFFPLEPAVLGHTLLVPTRHATFLWELEAEEARRLGEVASRMSGLLVDALGLDGLNLIQSNGDVATQTVPHVHFHLVPRWQDDPIGPIWPPETSYSDGAKNAAWAEIARACTRAFKTG